MSSFCSKFLDIISGVGKRVLLDEELDVFCHFGYTEGRSAKEQYRMVTTQASGFEFIHQSPFRVGWVRRMIKAFLSRNTYKS